LISLAYLASFGNFRARIRVIAVGLFLHLRGHRRSEPFSRFFPREKVAGAVLAMASMREP
jgi:hypothetical protein